MCIGKGLICRRGQNRPDYLMDSNDHEPLVEKFNLKDETLINRNFVRIELLPCGDLFSQNLKDWEFKVDETGTLPAWFEQEKEQWRGRCLDVLIDEIILVWKKTKSVGGYLDLGDTQVKSLGSLQSVGGYLDLGDTQVKSLPQKLKVKGNIYKDTIGRILV